MNGYDYVMATVCGILFLLSAFGFGVYLHAKRHMNTEE